MHKHYKYYFISFIDENEIDWCILTSSDYDYIYRIFQDICFPSEYIIELRGTDEDIETCLDWEVLATK